MSCDGNRSSFFRHACGGGGVVAALGGGADGEAGAVTASAALEQIFDLGRAQATSATPNDQKLAEAQTRALFMHMQQAGIKPPTHSPTGLPRKDAQFGYAQVYRTLTALKTGQPLPAVALHVQRQVNKQATEPTQTRRISALRQEVFGRTRCGSCGQFAPQAGGHLCRNSASAEAIRATLTRRLGVPATAYPHAPMALLRTEASRRGHVTMRHALTGEMAEITLDALPLALTQGFTPDGWADEKGFALVDVGGRVVAVLDDTGLVRVTPPATAQAAAAQASGLVLDPRTAMVSTAAPLPARAAPPAALAETTTVTGGTAYDEGRFIGTEYRKKGVRGDLVTAGGITYRVGERSTKPEDYSSARHRGDVPMPATSGAFAGVAVGRTLVGAVELLHTGSVTETPEGVIEVHDADGHLASAYDPRTSTAADVDGTSNASAAQMAAVIAWRVRQPGLSYNADRRARAFTYDLGRVITGASGTTPLAAADSAYLIVKNMLDDEGPIILGGTLGASKCPTCGKFVGQAGCLSPTCAQAAAASSAATASESGAPEDPRAASRIAPHITVNVEAPQLNVEAPQLTVEAPQVTATVTIEKLEAQANVTVEPPQVSVEPPQVSVTVEPPQVTANVTAQIDPAALAAAFGQVAGSLPPLTPVAPVAMPVAASADAPVSAPALAPVAPAPAGGTDPALVAALAQLAANQIASEQRMLTILERLAGQQSVNLPRSTDAELLRSLERHTKLHRTVAGQLARQLERIRAVADQRVRNQTSGKLDQRRLVAAMRGNDEVRIQVQEQPATSMAVGVQLDFSGSMGKHIASGAVYNAASILAQTFEDLGMAYEVRGHADYPAQFKSFGDPTRDPARMATMSTTGVCGSGNRSTATDMALTTSALLGRTEANKLAISLMDGQMGDHAATVLQLQEARKQGVVTFGVFLGTAAPTQQKLLDELFGQGSWVQIAELTAMPQLVGRRLARIFESIGK